jgi:small neutral amino acid transporter SnatA (MarC family)
MNNLKDTRSKFYLQTSNPFNLKERLQISLLAGIVASFIVIVVLIIGFLILYFKGVL